MAIDSYAVGTSLIVASTLAAVIGLILFRRMTDRRGVSIAHEASGHYLSIVGTLYAVLLGLIVVDAMGRFQQAGTLVGDESNALAELIYLAGGMPGPQKAEVWRRSADYAHLVIDHEWTTMARGHHLPAARRSCIELMELVRAWEPSSESEKAVYAEAVEAASRFWNARRLRIIACQRGIPALEWCLVLLGGIITVGLTYLLVLEDLRVQTTLTAMVALLIALNIFLILMFAYPFSGDLRVSPESFRVALAALKLEETLPTPH